MTPPNSPALRDHHGPLILPRQLVGVGTNGLLAAAWMVLVGWKLFEIPGVNMDEAWNVLAVLHIMPQIDPLSGMMTYTGALPVFLVWLVGPEHGLAAQRVASVLCNFAALVILWKTLCRLLPERSLRGWALPLVATVPVWLVFVRNAIEIVILGPLTAALGIYLLLKGERFCAFLAGATWGLAIYNHVLAAFFPASLGLAWLVVYRRMPPVLWPPLVAGFVCGLMPRLVSLVYFARPETGHAAGYDLGQSFEDLINLPGVWWDVLNGPALYLRVTGYLAEEVWPTWVLSAAFVLPWLRHPQRLPKHAQVTLATAAILLVLSGLLGLRLTVRYLMMPSIVFVVFLVQSGASAIAHDSRWRPLIASVATIIIGANLYYVARNFYLPWARQDLRISHFALGNRNRRETNTPFLPKRALVRALSELDVAQVIASPSIHRPLAAMMYDSPIRVTTGADAARGLRSALVRYAPGSPPPPLCRNIAKERRCLRNKTDVGLFSIYH